MLNLLKKKTIIFYIFEVPFNLTDLQENSLVSSSYNGFVFLSLRNCSEEELSLQKIQLFTSD